ncbi:hypothetical protein [Micromonospora zamorensis]|uniref:hypothetical protein n=1 Tax=Micromonospora zamorensis TaxID=709883 RepID=UPI003790562F
MPRTVPPQRADDPEIPLFGARTKARELAAEVTLLWAELERVRSEMNRLGVLPAVELEQYRERLTREITEQTATAQAQKAVLERQLRDLSQQVVVTEETALLQEAGVYDYRHPTTQNAVLNSLQRLKQGGSADRGPCVDADVVLCSGGSVRCGVGVRGGQRAPKLHPSALAVPRR